MKTLDAGRQGCSWKRCQRMPAWYGSTWGFAVWGLLPTDCHVYYQTAPVSLGRSDQVLDAVPGHLAFHLETPQPCWRSPEGLSEEAGLCPRSPLLSPVHLTGGRLLHGGHFQGGWLLQPPLYLCTSVPLSASGAAPSGWCRWSSNPLPNSTVLFLVSPAP